MVYNLQYTDTTLNIITVIKHVEMKLNNINIVSKKKKIIWTQVL